MPTTKATGREGRRELPPNGGGNGAAFSYAAFTSRNAGFVSAGEQERLRRAHVLVAGVGGLGGAAVDCLVRSGVGRLTITDIERERAADAREDIARINPECRVRVFGGEWTALLPGLLGHLDIAVNGCDDVPAALALMRAGRLARVTVIDAFGSTLPNVCVVRADDPRPEELLGYPSVGLSLAEVGPDVVAGCRRKQLEWVLTHSTAAEHVALAAAAEMLAGGRPRPSFAPMACITGCLMACEVIRAVLGRPGGPGPGGLFWNPWTGRVERPRRALAAVVRRSVVRRRLAGLRTKGVQG